MTTERVSVGHPVDVSSGAVFTAMHDFFLPGLLDVDWKRFYSTDSSINAWLGRGWCVLHFMTLERVPDGYLLTDEQGRTVLFEAPFGLDKLGDRVTNVAAHMELHREPDCLAVLHWHDGGNEIERFCFKLSLDDRVPLSWMETLAGHRISVQYDNQRRPVRVQQEVEQRSLEVVYGHDDLIQSIVLALPDGGRKQLVQYTYDADRRLIAVVNAAGATTRYGYDEQHRLVTETNALGSTFSFQYDAESRCIYSSGDDRFMERRLHYDATLPLTISTDSLGNETRYYLNAAGLVLQQVSPSGAPTTTSYDEYGRIRSITDPAGGIVQFEYDDRGDRVAVVNEDGGRYELAYNERHQLVRLTDPMGGVWTYQHDERGRVIGVTNALGITMACKRDALGMIVQSIRGGGAVVTRRYDRSFRWQETSDEFGLIYRAEYDALGNETALIDAAGVVRRTVYDTLNRPVAMTDAAGGVIRCRWNALNLLTERTEPGGGWERWQYDSVGRLVGHETVAGTMALEYDTEENLIAVVNRAGERLERTYDGEGRLRSERTFDGRLETYDYDLRGMPVQITKADGRVVTQDFDVAGFMVRRSTSDGYLEELAYDRNARLVRAANAHAIIEIERNLLGKINAEILNGRRIEYTYDVDNNRSARRLPDGSEVRLSYDSRGRVTRITDGTQSSQELRWDALDRIVERQMPGAVEQLSYDASRELREQVVKGPRGRTSVSRRYQYDERGNIASRTERNTGTTEFSYDGINRLTSATQEQRVVERYRYDAVGTIAETHEGARTTARGGRTLTDPVRRYVYDAAGCIARLESSEGDYDLTYDVDGNLTKVESAAGLSVTYGFDPLGRRVSRDVNGSKTEFLWQGCDLAAEVENDAITASFLFYAREPLAEWRGSNAYYPICDRTGAVRELLDKRGEVTWQSSFQTYGEQASEVGAPASAFRFRGQYFDFETGFHYNFHRTYDPRFQNFLSPDPVGLTGGANFYAYPRNPLRWDDPFGLTCGKNKCKGQEGEKAMEDALKKRGYERIDSPGRPRGIDGVFEKKPDDGVPPKYIIAEAKFGSAGLGNTVHSDEQMSDNWIDTGIGKPGPNNANRLDRAVGNTPPDNTGDSIRAAAATPGNVSKEVHTTPGYGQPATVTGTGNYVPGSGGTTF